MFLLRHAAQCLDPASYCQRPGSASSHVGRPPGRWVHGCPRQLSSQGSEGSGSVNSFFTIAWHLAATSLFSTHTKGSPGNTVACSPRNMSIVILDLTRADRLEFMKAPNRLDLGSSRAQVIFDEHGLKATVTSNHFIKHLVKIVEENCLTWTDPRKGGATRDQERRNDKRIGAINWSGPHVSRSIHNAAEVCNPLVHVITVTAKDS